MKQIGLAVHNFISVHGKLPPAVIYGPDGKPWHSWRVLLLPYLEANDIYNAYDYSEPWDSPKNKALLDKMPDVYRDPIHGDKKEPYTHYAAFVGPGSVFPPGGAKQIDPKTPPLAGSSIGIQNITDGSSNTVIVSLSQAGAQNPLDQAQGRRCRPRFQGLRPAWRHRRPLHVPGPRRRKGRAQSSFAMAASAKNDRCQDQPADALGGCSPARPVRHSLATRFH